MSPLERAVMQQALDALRGCYGHTTGDGVKRTRAITALRKALAAANSPESGGIKTVVQQEPVLFIHPDTFSMASAHVSAWKPGHELPGYIPLYTAPPAEVPLTVDKLYNSIAHGDADHRAWLRVAIVNAFAGLPPPPFEKPAEVPLLTPGEVALMWIGESFDTMSHESCYVRGIKRGEQAVRQKAGIK